MKSRNSRKTTLHLGFSPLTLKDMVSSHCAFVCWCLELDTPNSERIWGNTWFKERTFHCEDILPVPVEIRSIINDKIRLIGQELENWLVHHLQIINFIPRQVMASCIFLNSPVGDVCYKRTAQNLLEVNYYAFNLREQFKIACRYCFEEDVRRLWAFLKDDPVLRKYSFNNIESRPGYVHSMDYWCSLMRGELKKFYGCGSEAKSPEWYVISNRPRMTIWAEMEYYWDKLNDKERNTLHRIFADKNLTKDLIFKYNLHQGVHIVLLRPYQTLHNLAENELYFHYTLQVWDCVKHSITRDSLFFHRILIILLPMAFNQTRKPKHSDHMVKLIKQIWLSTPQDLKNFICTSHERVQLVFEISKRYLCRYSFFWSRY
ncbi:uncharacterized protein LOC135847420 [Planococcus citri]|uniref:uncharacterized protein LOC135847420 n=1 Tax=Planococcus citri TaxID=170843 RepID=UPI0031F7D214